MTSNDYKYIEEHTSTESLAALKLFAREAGVVVVVRPSNEESVARLNEKGGKRRYYPKPMAIKEKTANSLDIALGTDKGLTDKDLGKVISLDLRKKGLEFTTTTDKNGIVKAELIDSQISADFFKKALTDYKRSFNNTLEGEVVSDEKIMDKLLKSRGEKRVEEAVERQKRPFKKLLPIDKLDISLADNLTNNDVGKVISIDLTKNVSFGLDEETRKATLKKNKPNNDAFLNKALQKDKELTGTTNDESPEADKEIIDQLKDRLEERLRNVIVVGTDFTINEKGIVSAVVVSNNKGIVTKEVVGDNDLWLVAGIEDNETITLSDEMIIGLSSQYSARASIMHGAHDNWITEKPFEKDIDNGVRKKHSGETPEELLIVIYPDGTAELEKLDEIQPEKGKLSKDFKKTIENSPGINNHGIFLNLEPKQQSARANLRWGAAANALIATEKLRNPSQKRRGGIVETSEHSPTKSSTSTLAIQHLFGPGTFSNPYYHIDNASSEQTTGRQSPFTGSDTSNASSDDTMGHESPYGSQPQEPTVNSQPILGITIARGIPYNKGGVILEPIKRTGSNQLNLEPNAFKEPLHRRLPALKNAPKPPGDPLANKQPATNKPTRLPPLK